LIVSKTILAIHYNPSIEDEFYSLKLSSFLKKADNPKQFLEQWIIHKCDLVALDITS